ncbi:MAG: hypothetical protein GY854_09435 [Deltaproteobacteria bacterium]|nr:hypothetical protein [Deltaproteobacteria bacterium]
MNRKRILLESYFFLAGIAAGLVAPACFIASYWSSQEEFMSLHDISAGADWSGRVEQAVSEEKPEVAIWALENYIDVLMTRETLAEETRDKNLLQADIVRAYIKLAVVTHKAGNEERKTRAVAEAIRYAKLCGYKRYEDLKTEDDVLGYEQKVKELCERRAKERQKNEPHAPDASPSSEADSGS